MKNCLTLLFLFISLATFGQNLEECGNDNNPTLSKEEAEFLNSYFSDQAFDFTGKKVIFVTGSNGKTLGTKSDYFNDVKQWSSREDTISTRVFILNKEEKRTSRGYDVIITYWVKVNFNDKAKQKIVIRTGK